MAEIPHGTSSGYSYWKCRCDECVSAKKARDRDYYERTKPPPKRQPAKYATAPERMTAWRKENPEQSKALRRRYREKYRTKLRADALARYHKLMAENPDLVRERRKAAAKTPKGVLANRAARHRRRGAKPTPDAVEYMAILVTDPCSYCGWPGGEVDHITPISAGGDGEWTNLTSACRGCNARKNDRSLMNFLNERAA